MRRRRLPLLILMSMALATGVRAEGVSGDVVVVVSARSPVATLAPYQVADIFLGKSNRFPDGKQAVPVDQSEDSAAHRRFYEAYANMSAAQVKARWSKIIFTGRGRPPLELANGFEVKKFLSEHPNAIGYIDETLVDDSVKVLLKP
jgi:ABC-type phosphate transport system substrate-binding protein